MPIDLAGFQRLEDHFGLKLPASYKKYLLSKPDLLQAPIIVSRGDLGRVRDALVLDEFGALMELNSEFRDYWPEMESDKAGRAFPDGLFLVGDDDGDLLAIRTAGFTIARFWIYRHEYCRWQPFAISMRHFAYRIRKMLQP